MGRASPRARRRTRSWRRSFAERVGGSALPDAPARHRLLPAGRERNFTVAVASPQPGPGGGAGAGHCRFPSAFTPSTAGGPFVIALHVEVDGAVEVLDVDLGAVAVLAGLILPLARAQLAFDA